MANNKWILYRYSNDDGPHTVLITDCVWWEENKIDILTWFTDNYPLLTPIDTYIINFENNFQYTLWQLTWS